jgi:Periplasmic binding protein
MRNSQPGRFHGPAGFMASVRVRAVLAFAAAALVAAALAACGSSGSSTAQGAPSAASSGASGGSSGGSEGVTSSSISLGLDVAQSGQAAPETVPFVQGIQTFWDRQNGLGGVCKRHVHLIFGDNGGDPQTELTAYTSMQDKILALQQISPSAGLEGVVNQLQQQNMLFSSSSTVNLFSVPQYYAVGTDFGHAVVDTIYWLMQHKGLKKGDTIGFLYGTGAYATEADLGAKFAAQQYGLKLVGQQLADTDTDMSGAVSAFKGAGAKYVVMVSLAPQDFNTISAAQAADYHPMWVAASFLASALGTSAGPVMKSSNFYVMGNGGNVDTANLSGTAPGVKDAIAAYKKYFHKTPDNPAILYGYAQAAALDEVISKSCSNGTAPTRGGLVKALASISTLNTDGLLPPLNYSVHKANVPPTDEIFLSKVNTKVVGSLENETSYFAAPEAAKLDLNGN